MRGSAKAHRSGSRRSIDGLTRGRGQGSVKALDRTLTVALLPVTGSLQMVIKSGLVRRLSGDSTFVLKRIDQRKGIAGETQIRDLGSNPITHRRSL